MELNYGTKILPMSMQHGAIEIIQKRILRIIYPGLEYDEAVDESKLKSLKQRRSDLCVDLIERMMQPMHIFMVCYRKKNPNMKSKTTRSSGKEIYNFYCRTERFRGSSIVFGI